MNVELSDDDRELLERHEKLLEAATNFLNSMPLALAAPSDPIILGLADRVLEVAHALQALCLAGYASEAGPLARAMLSATGSLVAICDKDRDARAFAYVLSAHTSPVRLERTSDHLGLTEQQAQTLADQIAAAARANARPFEEAGVTPAKLGPNPRTWHGLTDRDLFVDMKMAHWYDLLYVAFSEESHVTAGAIGPEVRQLLAGEVRFGPRFESVWQPLIASGKCIAESLVQLNNVYGWGRREEIIAFNQPLEDALSRYSTARYGHLLA